MAFKNAKGIQIFFNSGLATPYLNALRTKDETVGGTLLQALGEQDTPENRETLFNMANGVETEQETQTRHNTDLAKQIRKIASLNPKNLLIRAGVAAATEGLNTAADIAENNGNRLAAALMAAARTNSTKQNEIYGPSVREKYAEASANEKLRRAGNTSRILKGVSNVADKVFGMYNTADTMGRTMAAGAMGGHQMPATVWDFMGRNVTANKGK